MSDESDKNLDFSLPERPAAAARTGRGGVGFALGVLLVLAAANLFLAATRRGPGGAPEQSPAALAAGDLKQLALKLETQGLARPAAGTWREFLAAAGDGEADAGTIWYRIGTLYQDAGMHEEALAAFYRSESHGNGELASETGRRVRDSLEALGKFAALRHELADRVGVDDRAAEVSGEVVAEIGARKITRAELDRQIEAGIENQLEMLASQLPEDQRREQKEAMLRQFSGDRQRLQFLNGYIVEEILYRKARESKLTDDPAVRARLRDAERGILARQVMESELAAGIAITDGDLRTFYEANRAQYMEPATASLSHILVADEEAAGKVLARLAGGEKFAEVAKEVSLDEATRDRGGKIAAGVSRGGPVPGVSVPAGSVDALFEAAPGEVLGEPVKSEAGWHLFQLRERREARQRPFEEVRRQVHGELRRRKEQEVQAALLERLRDEYDVVIHQDAFAVPEARE